MLCCVRYGAYYVRMRGYLLENNVRLQSHEMFTINYLLYLGNNVSLLPRSLIEGRRTADILMWDLIWEIKTPRGHAKSAIHNAFGRGHKQSCYIVLDLRKVKGSQLNAIARAKSEFEKYSFIKRLLIISSVLPLMLLFRNNVIVDCFIKMSPLNIIWGWKKESHLLWKN